MPSPDAPVPVEPKMKNASPVPWLNWTLGGLAECEFAVTARIRRSAGGETVKSTRDTRWVTGPAPVLDSRISMWFRPPMNLYLETPVVRWNTDPVGPLAVIPGDPVVLRVTVRSPCVVDGAVDQPIDPTFTNSPFEMVIRSSGAADAGAADAIIAPSATSAVIAARALKSTSTPLDQKQRA
jgi:hypothetical protein